MIVNINKNYVSLVNKSVKKDIAFAINFIIKELNQAKNHFLSKILKLEMLNFLN
jgi:hypothetical protein